MAEDGNAIDRRTVMQSLGTLAAAGATGAAASTAGAETTPPYDPLGRLSISGGAAEVVTGDSGDVAYVSIDSGFVSVDISDPSNPQLLARRNDLSVSGVLDCKVDGDRLIVHGPANSSPGEWKLYDISDPANPVDLATVSTNFGMHNGFLADGVAYMIDNGAAEAVMYDVSDDDPNEVGRYGMSGARILHDLWVQDGIGYFNHWNQGTMMVDLSDPSNPREIGLVRAGSNKQPDSDHYVMVNEDASILALGKENFSNPAGVELWDISDKTDTEYLAEIGPPSSGSRRTSHNFDLRNGHIYTSFYEGGAWVHDLSDPANPERVGEYSQSGVQFWTQKVGVPGESVVATDYSNSELYVFPDPAEGGGDNQSPTAALDASTTRPSVGERVTFDASGSTDPDGQVVDYQWDFGDGTSASGETARHAYDATGDYTVTLTVTDDAGATDSAQATIDVREAPNDAPTAAIDASTTSPDVGESVTFDGGASVDPDGSIVDYSWDFGDGASASGETVSHAYSSAGSFTVRLTVTDDDGATDTSRADVTVSEEDNQVPTASIDVGTTAPTVGEDVDFDGSGSSDPDGAIASYAWDFGDGATASGEMATHAYSSAGDYTVTLEVTDDDGASDTATAAVTVEERPNEGPTANISVTPATPTVGEQATLNGSGSSDPDGTVVSYEWTVDGTSVGSGETLDYTFQSAGSHQVGLTVTDDDGATDGARQTVTVEEGEDGDCGDETDGGSAQSSLWGWWDEDSYTYAARTSDPCSVTFALEGPGGSDFDLYVTFDGRTPTTRDFDARSISPDSSEDVAVDNVDAGQEFGILVDSYRGSGSYTISAEELGK